MKKVALILLAVLFMAGFIVNADGAEKKGRGTRSEMSAPDKDAYSSMPMFKKLGLGEKQRER